MSLSFFTSLKTCCILEPTDFLLASHFQMIVVNYFIEECSKTEHLKMNVSVKLSLR